MILITSFAHKKNIDLNLVYDGDSQTYRGYYPTYLNAYLLNASKVKSLTTYNVAIAGRDSGQILAAQAANVLTKKVNGKYNLISQWSGANDAYHLLSDVDILANLTSYYNIAKSNGFKLMLVGCNSSTFDFGARMVEINILMRNNKETICDFFVDLSLDSRLSNPASATIYADGLHYTPLGYSYVTENIWPALFSYLNIPIPQSKFYDYTYDMSYN